MDNRKNLKLEKKEKRKMNLKKLNLTVLLVTILVLVPTIQIVYASPLSTLYLSGGHYPQGTYTLWKEASYYYAKNSYGLIAYSGTNASQILTSVSSACNNGGKIFLYIANYSIDATIPYYSDQNWIGETSADDVGGLGVTLHRTGDFPIFNVSASSLRHIKFQNLVFRGQGKGIGSTPLLEISALCGNVVIETCTFMKSGGVGVHIGETGWWITLINCESVSLTGALVYRPLPNSSTTLVMINCLSHYSGPLADLYGIRGLIIQGGGGDHFDNHAVKLRLCMGSVEGLDLEGNSVNGTNGHGLWLVSGGLHVAGNNIEDFGNDTGGYYPIYLSTYGYGSVIEANFVQTTYGTHSLRFAGDAEWYLVQRNNFDKPVTGYAGRPNLKMQYNYGYQTVATGTAEASNDDMINLPYTFAGSPNIVLLTVQESDANYVAQVKSTSTTQIQLYLYDLDASALETTNKTIAYYAEYKP